MPVITSLTAGNCLHEYLRCSSLPTSTDSSPHLTHRLRAPGPTGSVYSHSYRPLTALCLALCITLRCTSLSLNIRSSCPGKSLDCIPRNSTPNGETFGFMPSLSLSVNILQLMPSTLLPLVRLVPPAECQSTLYRRRSSVFPPRPLCLRDWQSTWPVLVCRYL